MKTITHICHVPGCVQPVGTNMLMCPAHARMLEPLLKSRLANLYRAGFENLVEATPEYRNLALECVDFVDTLETVRAEEKDKEAA